MDIKIEKVEGIYYAIDGMRVSEDSQSISDTLFPYPWQNLEIGPNDLNITQSLIRDNVAGDKFLSQIQVWLTVSIPNHIWRALEDYDKGTKSNFSLISRIKDRPFHRLDFFIGEDPIIMTNRLLNEHIIEDLNYFRNLYLETRDFRWVEEIKRILPSSYIETRLWNTNYSELRDIYFNHFLDRGDEEWRLILLAIESLPYSEELILYE